MKSRGFTLIELLVIIAIIAILSAIIFPVFTMAKRSSYRAVCSSNLMQISRAITMYTVENNDYYPNTGDVLLWQGRRWRWPIAPYTSFTTQYNPNDPTGPGQLTKTKTSIFACPADPTDASKWDKTSYVYSASFFHTPDQIDSIKDITGLFNTSLTCVSISTSMVAYPVQKVIIADWLAGHSGDVKEGMWSWVGGRNYLFADGHVQYRKSSSIKTANDAYPDINATKGGVNGIDVE
ncbi:MAG: type II secretion system protein [Armatimonadota bacterium]